MSRLRRLLPGLLLGLSLFVLAACGGGGVGDGPALNPAPANLPSNQLAVSVEAFRGGLLQAEPNRPYVTVTVCDASGSHCSAVDHVLLDTESTGLRLFAGALPTSTLAALTAVPAGNGSALAECYAFVSGYLWGGVRSATLQLGGTRTLQPVPVQIVGDPALPQQAPSSCSQNGLLSNLDGQLTANGILGVSSHFNDCNNSASCPTWGSVYQTCASPASTSCAAVPASASQLSAGVLSSAGQQLINPVAAMPAGSNDGIVLSLGAVGWPGAGSLGGVLVLGAHAADSPLAATAQTYALDLSGRLATTIGAQAHSGYLDTGTNRYELDTSTVSALTACAFQAAYLCLTTPTPTPVQLSVGISSRYTGSPGSSVSVLIYSADLLYGTGHPVMPGLSSSSVGETVLGLPFFFGRPVGVGIEMLSGSSYPYGYNAF